MELKQADVFGLVALALLIVSFFVCLIISKKYNKEPPWMNVFLMMLPMLAGAWLITRVMFR